MKIEKREIKPYKKKAFCDCGEELKFECSSLSTHILYTKDSYLHVCPKCEKKYYLDTKYPSIEFEDYA